MRGVDVHVLRVELVGRVQRQVRRVSDAGSVGRRRSVGRVLRSQVDELLLHEGIVGLPRP